MMLPIAQATIVAAAQAVLTAGVIVVGCVVAVPALYLMILSIAALFHSGRSSDTAPSTPIAVLVPAHNESQLIARCVRSLRDQTYPDDLYQIVVVADNCTDDTAAVAAGAGAQQVMRRDAPTSRGKGQALRWALDRVLAWKSPPTAIVIVDADSTAASDLIAALVRRFEAGAGAVQGMYLLSGEGARETSLSTIALMLVNRVRPTGLTVLRLPGIQLNGNGMLLSREVLDRTPWTAFSSAEDLEYSLMLQMAGETIAYAGDGAVSAPPAPSAESAATQRLRWHGGRMYLTRTWTPRLVARAILKRRPSLLAVALGLAVPPLGLLTATVVTGSAAAALFSVIGIASVWAVVPWAVALLSIPTSVLVGLRSVNAPSSQYRALLRAPGYVLRMVLGARSVLSFDADTWVRTKRLREDSPVEDG